MKDFCLFCVIKRKIFIFIYLTIKYKIIVQNGSLHVRDLKQ